VLTGVAAVKPVEERFAGTSLAAIRNREMELRTMESAFS